MVQNNPYKPVKAEIKEVITETPTIKTFRLELEKPLEFATGQFVQLTFPGSGECPFTPSSKPGKGKNIDVTAMRVGTATEVLHTMEAGDMLGVRGPYGNGFPLDILRNKELLIVGGGCGMAPLRSLFLEILGDRKNYPRVVVLYGCRTPQEVLYKKTFGDWKSEMEVHRTVDTAAPEWEEGVGVVTTLFEKIAFDAKKCVAVVVGPPVMMKFATIELEKRGVSDDRIIVSLEKNMTCGFGKCRHCITGHYYVCKDGPVFLYRDVKNIPDLWE
jgi:NAD(P)H-flavin reductase